MIDHETRASLAEPPVSPEVQERLTFLREQRDAEVQRQADEEAKALLEKVGLDHVPTVEEAKALLDGRRQEIRREVMRQADIRDWCEDGTRKVCANLRIERPGQRDTHQITLKVELTMTFKQSAYTVEGALERMRRTGQLSPQWLNNHLYADVNNVSLLAASVDGKEIETAQILAEEKPEVTA